MPEFTEKFGTWAQLRKYICDGEIYEFKSTASSDAAHLIGLQFALVRIADEQGYTSNLDQLKNCTFGYGEQMVRLRSKYLKLIDELSRSKGKSAIIKTDLAVRYACTIEANFVAIGLITPSQVMRKGIESHLLKNLEAKIGVQKYRKFRSFGFLITILHKAVLQHSWDVGEEFSEWKPEDIKKVKKYATSLITDIAALKSYASVMRIQADSIRRIQRGRSRGNEPTSDSIAFIYSDTGKPDAMSIEQLRKDINKIDKALIENLFSPFSGDKKPRKGTRAEPTPLPPGSPGALLDTPDEE